MATTLTTHPLPVVRVLDPRLDMSIEDKQYMIKYGASQSTLYKYNASSSSGNNLSFNVVSPSPNTILSRNMSITFTAQLQDAFLPYIDQSSIDTNKEGPRQLPLHSSSNSTAVTVDSTTFSWKPDEIINGLMTTHKSKNHNFNVSSCPLTQDQHYQYSNIGAPSAKSPFISYNSQDIYSKEISRNGFNYNLQITNKASGRTAPQIVTFTVTEPVIIPGVTLFDETEEPGLIGVRNVSLTYNFNPSRMWSGNQANGAATFSVRNMTMLPSGTAFTSPPVLNLWFYTLPDTISINPYVVWPIKEIDSYGIESPIINANDTTNMTTNSLTLSSVPSKIYHFARPNKAGIASRHNNVASNFEVGFSPFTQSGYCDSFGLINKASITFANKSGILSSCKAPELYKISVRNGCQLSFAQWTAGCYNGSNYDIGTNTTNQIPMEDRPGPGSVLILSPADLSLDSSISVGCLGNYQYSAHIDVFNPLVGRTQAPQDVILSSVDTSFHLYTVIVSEGLLTYTSQTGTYQKQLGVVSTNEVLTSEIISADDNIINNEMSGGSFLSTLKNVGKNILKVVGPGARFLGENLSKIPHPIASSIGSISGSIGNELQKYGYGKGKGGKMITHQNLLK